MERTKIMTGITSHKFDIIRIDYPANPPYPAYSHYWVSDAGRLRGTGHATIADALDESKWFDEHYYRDEHELFGLATSPAK